MKIEAVKQTIWFALLGLIKQGKFIYKNNHYYYDNLQMLLQLDEEANAYLLEVLDKKELNLGDL